MASEDKQTAFAVVEWLHDSLAKVSGDDKEGIETAIQIIEEAFSVNTQDAGQKSSLSLKPASLSQVLQVYKRTKAGSSSSSASAAGAAAGSAPAASSSSTTTGEHTNARDKAAAEDLKSQGNAEMAAKRYEQAINLYGQAIEKDGLNPVYYSNRAAAYSQVGKHEEAITDAKKASEVDPTFSKAYSRLGHALYCSGRYAEAAEAYENGLKHDPNNATMKSSLATAKAKAQTDDPASDDEADVASPAARGAGGAGGFPGMGGGGGGMPDLASLMNNPQIMQMAQQMMGNGGMEQLMNNPMMRQMADNFRNGGGMPSMNDIMNNPQLAQMAQQMGMGGGGGGGAGGAGR